MFSTLRSWLMALVATVGLMGVAARPQTPSDDLSSLGAEQWGIEEGLGSNWVRDVAEDKRGFLWVATHGGLSRFDGRRFVDAVRPIDTTSRYTAVSSLARTANGRLWAGLEYGGVMEIVGDALVPLPPARRLPDDAQVLDMASDGRETLWVAAIRGLWRIDAEGTQRVALDGLKEIVVAGIDHRDGELWVRTRDHGLWRSGVEGWERVEEPDGQCRGQGVSVGRRIVVTSCSSGVWRRSLDGGDWVRLPVTPGISAVFIDRQERIWFGADDGLSRLDGDHRERREADRILADARLRAFYEDRRGDRWIGTFGGGLVRLRTGPVRVHGPTSGLPSGATTAVLDAGDGSILVGTHRAGLRAFSSPRGVIAEWHEADGLPGDTVWALAADPARDGIWVGGSRGLAWLQGGRLSPRSPDGLSWSSPVNVVYVDPNQEGGLWIGGADGRVHRVGGRHVGTGGPEHDLDAGVVRFIHRRGDGTLLVGGRDGLFQRHPGGWTRVTVAGLRLRGLSAVTEAADGTLWLASTLDGLIRWPDGEPAPEASPRPSPFTPAHSLWQDDVGNLWVSGNEGIARLSGAALSLPIGNDAESGILRLGPRDGLRPTETNGWGSPSMTPSAGGTVAYPGIEGLVIVDPHALHAEEARPEGVFIEQVRAGGSMSPLAPRIVLGPEQRSVAIAFSAIEFERPEALRFRFRLEGLDEAWTTAGRGEEARYPRLPPGRFRFQLEARVGEGPWEPAAPMDLVVAANWHERTGVRAAGAFLIVATIAALVLRKRASLRRHRAQWRRARDFLRSVIDAHPHPIFVRQPDGRFLLANRAMAELVGRPPEVLEGEAPTLAPLGRHGLETFDALHAAVLASGKAQRLPELQVVDATGWRRWFRIGMWPFGSSPGTHVEQVIGVAEDITESVVVQAGLEEREAALRHSREEARDLARRLLDAQEEERRAIANELHDDYTQRLAGLALLAWGAHRRAGAGPGSELRPDLEELATELEKVARSIQHASRELHPPELGSTGLVESLRMACATFSRRSGLAVRVDVEGTGPEPAPEVSVAVYRIVQQALHNTLVHGGVGEATLSIRVASTAMHLEIADAGIGFDTAAQGFQPGLGMASMRERARLAGIGLSLESATGQGTRLRLDVPLA